MTITLHYIFALSQNALTLWRNVIASVSYRSDIKVVIIAFYSYHYKLADQALLLL
jgi:hypothetical protein